MSENSKSNWALTAIGCLLIIPFAIIVIPAILPLIPILILIGITALGTKLLGLDKH